MPGTLAHRLSRDFVELVPEGWKAVPEFALFPPAFERRIGYDPHADLLLVSPRGERVIVEVEGSRADVVANLWVWNDELEEDSTLSWERRRAKYFVYDPGSGAFAPSKFCAFLPARGAANDAVPATMTASRVRDARRGRPTLRWSRRPA